jgi:hypothetical protein
MDKDIVLWCGCHLTDLVHIALSRSLNLSATQVVPSNLCGGTNGENSDGVGKSQSSKTFPLLN